jgi:hypothetical protein
VTGLTNWATGGTVTYKPFDSDPPSFDTANKKVTLAGTVLSTEGNGGGSTSVTEVGAFNADGTPVMCLRIVHTAITKTATRVISYSITVEQA